MGNHNRDSRDQRGGQPPRAPADVLAAEPASTPTSTPVEAPSAQPHVDEMVRVEGVAPDSSALISEIATLRTRAETAEARVTELEAEIDGARATIGLRDLALDELRREKHEALDAQKRRFDEAWVKRELDLAAEPPGPVKGYRAVGKHVLVIEGRRVRVEHGQPFPEGYDITTLPKGTFEEIR